MVPQGGEESGGDDADADADDDLDDGTVDDAGEKNGTNMVVMNEAILLHDSLFVPLTRFSILYQPPTVGLLSVSRNE